MVDLTYPIKPLQQAEKLLHALGDLCTAQRLAQRRLTVNRAGLHLVVFGEFNRGKSTLINALLGRVVLPAKLVPTTGHVTSVMHGSPEEVRVRFLDGRWDTATLDKLDSFSSLTDGLARDDIDTIEVAVRSSLLRDGLVLVDTPGISDTDKLTARARAAVEQADLVLFLLDATQLLGDHERQSAVDWITRELDKPLVPVVNRMNLVEGQDRKPLRERIDRWARQHLPPVLGRSWFEVNALGALRHELGRGPVPTDDFVALRKSLKKLSGGAGWSLQQRGRRRFASLRDQSTSRTEQSAPEDSAGRRGTGCAQRQQQRQHLQTQLRWLQDGHCTGNARLLTYAERQIQEELQWLLGKIRGASNAELKKRYGGWYQQAAADAVGCIEAEGNGLLQALAVEQTSWTGPLDSLTIQERLTLDDRIQVASRPSSLRTVLGDGITDWIERRLGIDHSKPFADSAREQWAALRDRIVRTLQAQWQARLGVLCRHVERKFIHLDALEKLTSEAIEKRRV